MIPVKGQINELKDHVEEASQKKKKKRAKCQKMKIMKEKNQPWRPRRSAMGIIGIRSWKSMGHPCSGLFYPRSSPCLNNHSSSLHSQNSRKTVYTLLSPLPPTPSLLSPLRSDFCFQHIQERLSVANAPSALGPPTASQFFLTWPLGHISLCWPSFLLLLFFWQSNILGFFFPSFIEI